MQLVPANWIIAIALMLAFYRMAAYEAQRARGRDSNRLLWPLLSLLSSIIVIRILGGGVFSVLIGQFGLFLGIGIWRATRD